MPSHCIQTTADVPKPIVKPKIISRVDNLAWVFSDKFGLRQRLLQELNFRTLHFYHDLHSRSQCQRLLNEIVLQRPLVLWIRFAGPCVGSGNRQDALRAENLIRILSCQRNANRFVIVEASERSQVWNLQCVRDCTKTLLQTSHRWCRYENVLKSNKCHAVPRSDCLPISMLQMAVNVDAVMSNMPNPKNLEPVQLPASRMFCEQSCTVFVFTISRQVIRRRCSLKDNLS